MSRLWKVLYNYKLTIAYDGTSYSGWQIQKNGLSIQECIERVLAKIFQTPLSLVGAGRTDAGVHAEGQVAHFKYEKKIDLHKLHTALNALLPPDIRILDAEEVDLDFHARYDALSKEYHYHLHLDQVRDPFTRLYRCPVSSKVSLPLIEESLSFFIGTHDFSSFIHEREKGSCAKNPVRTLTSLKIVPQEGGVRLEFKGNGFLYKMVRNITGTLLEVGFKKIKPQDILTIFEKKDRKAAGPTAPPQGLFLIRVTFK